MASSQLTITIYQQHRPVRTLQPVSLVSLPASPMGSNSHYQCNGNQGTFSPVSITIIQIHIVCCNQELAPLAHLAKLPEITPRPFISNKKKCINIFPELAFICLHLSLLMQVQIHVKTYTKPDIPHPHFRRMRQAQFKMWTHQLLTCKMVRPVSWASCFFCSSDGYGCYGRQQIHTH